MATGTVKWFDPQKGFGFILNQSGDDVFVHYTSIEGEGFRCLRNGQCVQYVEVQSAKGLHARMVKLSADDPRDTGQVEQKIL
ncbi:MAG: cold-shock protein [Planctomycetaceae bacterium]|nr:cold-shock protein [Planctomycetaceae bacterium]